MMSEAERLAFEALRNAAKVVIGNLQDSGQDKRDEDDVEFPDIKELREAEEAAGKFLDPAPCSNCNKKTDRRKLCFCEGCGELICLRCHDCHNGDHTKEDCPHEKEKA